jgi:two-component system, LytTR family, response regulator
MLQEHAAVIEIVGEARNGGEAIALIEELKPDVVFLDIQMPDITGLEVVEKLQVKPNIIFTTAYEQYAIKAFETFSIDYLLKPVREERLAASIEKLKQFGKIGQVHTVIPDLQQLIDQLKAPKKATALPVKTGERIILLRYETIAYFEANDKYVFIYTKEGQKHLTDHTLSHLADSLPEQFLRVQKSFIINKELIREIHKHFNGRYIITLDDKAHTQVTTGLTYYDNIRKELSL